MGRETELPKEEGEEKGEASTLKYIDFLSSVAPDRVCHVCGHDKFVACLSQHGPQTFRVTIPEQDRHPFEDGSEPRLDCYAHFCDRCGTVTFTLKQLVEERTHGDV